MMDIESEDDTLRKLALGGSMDYSSWPLLLCYIVARLEKIARYDFRIPVLPPPTTRLAPAPEPRFLAPLPSSDPIGPNDSRIDRNGNEGEGEAGPAESSSSSSSQETNKENANPAQPSSASTTQPEPRTPTRSQGAAPTELLEAAIIEQMPRLPPQIMAQLTEITSTLTKSFPSYPPHTIQRLAELVLRPRQHYRSLITYLHAVDRVVHVASGSNVFPLSTAAHDATAVALANGTVGGRPSSAASSSSPMQLGPDEAMGGTLLTPIPWLVRRAESIDGADAALSPEADMMEGDDADADNGLGGSSPHHQHQHRQQPGSGRSRHQQRLSTESTETIEGPNGVGHIETVSVSVNGVVSHGAGTSALAAALSRGSAGSQSPSSSVAAATAALQGITQGELPRDEQRQGVVAVGQVQRNAAQGDDVDYKMDDVTATEPGADEARRQNGGPEVQGSEETPHVRGPEEIGLADTGPQAAGTSFPAAGEAAAPAVDVNNINVEAAVGRPADSSATPASASASAAEDAESVADGASPVPKREAEGSPAGNGELPPVKKVKADDEKELVASAAAAAADDSAAGEASKKGEDEQ